ncbi:MAG TPA: ISNCY family transposase [Thermoanaerobaculia bacterium]
MRQTRDFQPSLTYPWLDLDHAKELKALSDLLDEHPRILDLVLQDLSPKASDQSPDAPLKGAHGLTAEQVFRALILKQMRGFSYRELHFHLADSQTYRTFCRLGCAQKIPSKSALCRNIKRLRAQTLEQINHLLIESARDRGIEKGSKVRVDCTVVETNIHPPADSQQLWDCIRVLTRLMGRVRELLPAGTFVFSNRKKRAKRRCREISTTGNKQIRQEAYRDLLKVTEDVVVMARQAQDRLDSAVLQAVLAVARQEALSRELRHFLALTDCVLDQTRQRVLDGQSVPANEKIVSIFEEHTDVIRKDYKDTYYGHKICLSAGKSSMILDCRILDGNPADVTLALDAVTRLTEIYARPPRQVVFDGSFASKENLQAIKELGPRDVVFTKGRHLKISDMAKSTWVYRNLRRFRAGIEGCISFLKRAFGLDRCTWRSLRSFESYVWSSIIACNLLLMARALIS